MPDSEICDADLATRQIREELKSNTIHKYHMQTHIRIMMKQGYSYSHSQTRTHIFTKVLFIWKEKQQNRQK